MNSYDNFPWQKYPMKGYGVNFLVPNMEYICVRRYKKSSYNATRGRHMKQGSYYYYLFGTDNQIVEVVKSDLLKLMKANKINVKNLKIYSDDRIFFLDEVESAEAMSAEKLVKFKNELSLAKEDDEALKLRTPKNIDKANMQGKFYYEEIRKGMLLRVAKTSWAIEYPIKFQNTDTSGYPVGYSNGVFVLGLNVSEHISEIKDCYKNISEIVTKNPNKSISSYFYGTKYEFEYRYEVGEFLFKPYRGMLVVVGKDGMKQWVSDIEFCINRVEEIRDELGWKTHKGFLGKLFDAY